MRNDRAVLFDLGNVLVSIHPEAFAATLNVSDSERGHYRPRVIAVTQRYERGELSTEEFFSDLGRVFAGKYVHSRLEEAMRNVIGKPIQGMAELLEKTARKTNVALVSNTNEFHFEHCRRNFPFLSLIPRYFLSWEMRVLKPYAEYYSYVLRELNVPADRAIFIDDLRENVDGAQKAGMIGIVFNGGVTLAKKLEQFGVI